VVARVPSVIALGSEIEEVLLAGGGGGGLPEAEPDLEPDLDNVPPIPKAMFPEDP